jgi:hypothetical protein
MGKRANVKATARHTKQIVLETQQQTAVLQQIEAKRAREEAQRAHEQRLAAQQEFEYRYATDPTFRAFTDAKRAEEARQKQLAAEAWAAAAPERARQAELAAARAEQKRRADAQRNRRIGIGVALLFLLSLTVQQPLVGIPIDLAVAALWYYLLRRKLDERQLREAETAQERQHQAALASLTEDDREWLREHGGGA